MTTVVFHWHTTDGESLVVEGEVKDRHPFIHAPLSIHVRDEEAYSEKDVRDALASAVKADVWQQVRESTPSTHEQVLDAARDYWIPEVWIEAHEERF